VGEREGLAVATAVVVVTIIIIMGDEAMR